MLDDKYIGLALAISGTFAIGSSFIVTKKAREQIIDITCISPVVELLLIHKSGTQRYRKTQRRI
jgi:hypothetical protein